LTEAKSIHKRQTHPVIKGMLHRDYEAGVQLQKHSGREHQEEVIGDKPPVVK
jgi:hypothetical protein